MVMAIDEALKIECLVTVVKISEKRVIPTGGWRRKFDYTKTGKQRPTNEAGVGCW
jgi:hypothetical protein